MKQFWANACQSFDIVLAHATFYYTLLTLLSFIVWFVYVNNQPLRKLQYSLTALDMSKTEHYNLYENSFHCRTVVVYSISFSYVYNNNNNNNENLTFIYPLGEIQLLHLTHPFLYRHEASTPTHKINKYIVYESCIMELFAGCPVCTRMCDVKTRKLGTFLSVEQHCPHCEFYRHWNSQFKSHVVAFSIRKLRADA